MFAVMIPVYRWFHKTPSILDNVNASSQFNFRQYFFNVADSVI